MRYTKKVSMWPVGLIGTAGVSSPIVDAKSKKIVDFYDSWIGGRTFAVDMASFAVNISYFLEVGFNFILLITNSIAILIKSPSSRLASKR